MSTAPAWPITASQRRSMSVCSRTPPGAWAKGCAAGGGSLSGIVAIDMGVNPFRSGWPIITRADALLLRKFDLRPLTRGAQAGKYAADKADGERQGSRLQDE